MPSEHAAAVHGLTGAASQAGFVSLVCRPAPLGGSGGRLKSGAGVSRRTVGIYDGDLLIVDKSLDPRNFSTVIANVNEELVVKTLIKERGASYLTSGSKNILDKINLTENPEIVIWGVVTYVIHKQQ